MKHAAPYTCDAEGCGVEKTPSNGWLLIKVTPNRYDQDKGIIEVGNLYTSPWDSREADIPGTLHICGVGCASKVFSAEIAKLLNH